MADFTSFTIPAVPTTDGVAVVDSASFVPAITGDTVAYYQRVWDIINGVWCYYTAVAVDPNPVPADTTPAHSGSIGFHSILAVI